MTILPPYDPTSGYLRDILTQPAALEASSRGLNPLPNLGGLPEQAAAGEFERIVLTGMGSSYYALYPLYYTLANRGWPVSMLETSELIHHAPGQLGPRAWVVAVSQSGRSAETVRLLELAAERGSPVLGVSNTPGSPLERQANACLLTQAGAESTVSCKTYLAALLALRGLECALTGQDPALAREEGLAVAGALRGYLNRWRESVAEFEASLAAVQHLFFVGRGPSLAACGTGGLIVKEAAHVHAEGMSSAALRHGPLEMLGAGCFVLVFAGEEPGRALNAGLFADLQGQGIPAGWAEMNGAGQPLDLPEVPAALRAVAEILPVQLMSLALARLRGRTAGVFTRGSKVTIVE